jgi:hypothetical protein
MQRRVTQRPPSCSMPEEYYTPLNHNQRRNLGLVSALIPHSRSLTCCFILCTDPFLLYVSVFDFGACHIATRLLHAAFLLLPSTNLRPSDLPRTGKPFSNPLASSNAPWSRGTNSGLHSIPISSMLPPRRIPSHPQSTRRRGRSAATTNRATMTRPLHLHRGSHEMIGSSQVSITKITPSG